MKRVFYLAVLLAISSASPPESPAQKNEAFVEASLSADRESVFEKESVRLTLLLKSRGVRLSQQMKLINLPNAAQLETVTDFAMMPTERKVDGHGVTELRCYICHVRPRKIGRITIAPILRVHVLRRRALFIGSRTEKLAHDVEVAPITLIVTPIPAPKNQIAPSGAVGNFIFTARAEPTSVAVGDLVKVTMRIKGKGFRDGVDPPRVGAGGFFRFYEPRLIHDTPNEALYEQIVVPLSRKALRVPVVAFNYFHPRSGKHKQTACGPFPLVFHEATTTSFEQFRPEDEGVSEEPETSATSSSDSTDGRASRSGIMALLSRLAGFSTGDSATTIGNFSVHLAPSTSSFVLFELPAGSTIEIIQNHGEWVMIEFENKRGWLSASALP